MAQDLIPTGFGDLQTALTEFPSSPVSTRTGRKSPLKHTRLSWFVTVTKTLAPSDLTVALQFSPNGTNWHGITNLDAVAYVAPLPISLTGNYLYSVPVLGPLARFVITTGATANGTNFYNVAVTAVLYED